MQRADNKIPPFAISAGLAGLVGLIQTTASNAPLAPFIPYGWFVVLGVFASEILISYFENARTRVYGCIAIAISISILAIILKPYIIPTIHFTYRNEPPFKEAVRAYGDHRVMIEIKPNIILKNAAPYIRGLKRVDTSGSKEIDASLRVRLGWPEDRDTHGVRNVSTEGYYVIVFLGPGIKPADTADKIQLFTNATYKYIEPYKNDFPYGTYEAVLEIDAENIAPFQKTTQKIRFEWQGSMATFHLDLLLE